MDVRFLAPIATCIGIMTSIVLWLLNQRRKELSFRVLWKQPLVNLRGVAKRHLDIRFKGGTVSDAHLMILRIWNSGHLPISGNEFQTQLKIAFTPGTEVVSANVIETHPADLDERSKKDEAGKAFVDKIQANTIFLYNILLNPGDEITLQIIVRNCVSNPTVEGHIQGISRIHNWKQPTLIPNLLLSAGFCTMLFSMLAVDPSDLVTLGFSNILPFIFLGSCGFIIFWAGWLWLKDSNNEYANFRS